jgi:hypothetical protein
MPFTVRDRAPPRVPNDFQIEPDAGYAPTDEEKAVVASIHETLGQLAGNAALDGKGGLRAGLLAARAAFRAAEAGELRAIAVDFASGRIDAKAAADRCAVVAAKVAHDNPDVTIVAVAPERFAGEFAISATNYVLDAGEQAYVDRQKRLIDDLAADEAADIKSKHSDAGLEVRRAQRRDAESRLRQNFAFWKEGTSSERAAANVSYVRGHYAAQRERLQRKLFTVNAVPGTGSNVGYNVEVDIRLTDGLPPPNNEPTPEQRELYIEINRAGTVIGTVCRQIRARAHRRIWSQPDEDRRGLQLLGEYVDKLVGIGRIGLEGPQTSLAKLALGSLRDEFIAREAAEILNRYVRRLGMWSGGFALLFLLIYVIVRNYTCVDAATPCTSWWNAHKTFLLAAAGASLGTWASFSVRKVNLTFEQLAAPEEQLLDAPFRVVFVVVLTMAACLLFWTGAINVKIGDLNTEANWFSKVGTVAMLIGFFCGLSERALASAIAGRAAAFVSGVAGGK